MSDVPTSTPVILQQPRVSQTFHGYATEDPEKWLKQFKRVAKINWRNEEMKLQYVYVSLDGPAKTWYENHDTTLTTWYILRNEVLRIFNSIMRKERARLLLESSTQQSNETVNVYAEKIKRLSASRPNDGRQKGWVPNARSKRIAFRWPRKKSSPKQLLNLTKKRTPLKRPSMAVLGNTTTHFSLTHCSRNESEAGQ